MSLRKVCRHRGKNAQFPKAEATKVLDADSFCQHMGPHSCASQQGPEDDAQVIPCEVYCGIWRWITEAFELRIRAFFFFFTSCLIKLG